ncbi:MAG TPA: DUF4238 domain-containing protein, partial [Candidatus Paceibacterota bacterium]
PYAIAQHNPAFTQKRCASYKIHIIATPYTLPLHGCCAPFWNPVSIHSTIIKEMKTSQEYFTSRNHHYVSQCLLRNFDENKAFHIYDKIQNKFYTKPGPKQLFSDDYLNVSLVNGLKTDIIEQNLNVNFEKDFKYHYESIKNYIEKRESDITKSIEYIGRLGVIGEIRNKEYKKKMDKDVLGVFDEIKNVSAPNNKNDIQDNLDSMSELRYKLSLDFVSFANDVFKNMGDWEYNIFLTSSDMYFFLPDCTSILQRFKINEYFNPNCLDIGEIGMPIDSHTFINIISKKVRTNNFKIVQIDENKLFQINHRLLASAKCAIVCANENFLKGTISKMIC